MKKVLILLGIVLSFALVSCADGTDPFNANGISVSKGNIQVTLNDNPAKGIVIGSSQVTNAVITLTGPTGIVQTATWNVGSSSVFVFNAAVTGAYTLGLRQVDTSNNVFNTNVPANFVAGYNYYITISLGGNVIVNVGTNSLPPASSVSSTVSSAVSSTVSSVSVSSAVSSVSVSSAASSVAPGTTFGLYTESYPVNVVWDTDAAMDVWNGGFILADDTTTAEEGLHSLKLTAIATASITWAGLGMRVNPITDSKDLSAFVGGNLVFWYKSTKTITKVGVQDLAGNQAWITGAVCVSTYGMKTDGTWSKVTIPQSALAWNATHTTQINWSQINQYFMLVTDGANHASGNIYNLDNIYFTK